jgi:acetyl esterase/lipase
MDYLANDRHVTAQTPPTFLAHAADDNVVPPVNSKAFYDSCVAHHVSAELHIYPHGGHGFYPYDSTISLWAKDGIAWMQAQGILRSGTFGIPQSARRVASRQARGVKLELSAGTAGKHWGARIVVPAIAGGLTVHQQVYNLHGKLLNR